MIYRIISILLLFNLNFADVLFESNKHQSIDYKQESQTVINVNVVVGDITSSIVQANNQSFISINTENAYYSRNIGLPQLPQFNQLLEIPHESVCRIEIIKQNNIVINLDDIDIIPSQPSLSKSENQESLAFEYNADIYGQNQFINQNIIEINNK